MILFPELIYSVKPSTDRGNSGFHSPSNCYKQSSNNKSSIYWLLQVKKKETELAHKQVTGGE